MKYSFKLTEEIARWAFEVKCQKRKDWFIAFTNPTAGPWKTIKGRDSLGVEGEVYRFDLKETRPDIVLVNDSLKTIVVFEAKDSLKKLISGDQPQKSAEVVDKLCKKLSSPDLRKKTYWGKRADYSILTGLLWGTHEPCLQNDVNEALDIYYREMNKLKNIRRKIIVCVESREQAGEIRCKTYLKSFEKVNNGEYLESILKSLD